MSLSRLPVTANLQELSLWGVSHVSNDGIEVLAPAARRLRRMNLGGTQVSDRGLEAVGRWCRDLEQINLWSCRHVTARGLVSLVEACPALVWWNLWGIPGACQRVADLDLSALRRGPRAGDRHSMALQPSHSPPVLPRVGPRALLGEGHDPW